MTTARVQNVIMIAVAALVLGACGPKQTSESPATPQNLQVLADVRQAVTGATSYAAAEVDVTRSEYRVAVSVTKSQPDSSDAAAMEAEASTIATAVEKLLPTKPELSQIQVISVAYVHRHGTADTHTDDVFEFRKTPNGSFQHHVT